MAFKKGNFREKAFQKARKHLQEALSSPDLLVAQTVNSIIELDKVTNLLSERLVEWYGLHFPEFRSNDPKKYARAVLAMDRENPDKQELAKALGNENSALAVIGKAKASSGVAFADEDFKAVRGLAKQVLELYVLRESLEKYQNSLAQRICPNLSYLLGPALAAKLVAHAGSLKKLSSFPSSTVQVLGAEKALFKHIRSGSSPPKHGLIFQHAKISTSPKKLRGKIARALAGKIAIASKADAYSGHFIAKELREKFESRYESIMSSRKK